MKWYGSGKRAYSIQLSVFLVNGLASTTTMQDVLIVGNSTVEWQSGLPGKKSNLLFCFRNSIISIHTLER